MCDEVQELQALKAQILRMKLERETNAKKEELRRLQLSNELERRKLQEHDETKR